MASAFYKPLTSSPRDPPFGLSRDDVISSAEKNANNSKTVLVTKKVTEEYVEDVGISLPKTGNFVTVRSSLPVISRDDVISGPDKNSYNLKTVLHRKKVTIQQ